MEFGLNSYARLAIVLSSIFLVILFLLHFLEPEFNPLWRMISEYELGSYGWMMSLAFFCWGGSMLALNKTNKSKRLSFRAKAAEIQLNALGIWL